MDSQGRGIARGRRIGRACGLGIAAILAVGCATRPDLPADTPSLARHTWWNYYERATSLMREGRVADAEPDFERALGVRPGAPYGMDRDAWRARTYGIHVLEHYFPNRELGICLYLQAEAEQAIPWLEKSLDQAPSGRAKYYLNLARRDALAGRLTPPPEILPAPASLQAWTRERKRLLAGYARGSGFVRSLSVNGRPQFIELAQERIDFEEMVSLREGTNVLSVDATDLLGQKASATVEWIADWRIPELSVRGMVRKGSGWELSGTCSDDSALVSVSTDGRSLFRGSPAERRTSAPVSVWVADGAASSFEAEDAAGNRLRVMLTADALRTDREKGEAAAAGATEWAMEGVSDAALPGATSPPAPAGATDRLRPSLRLSCREATEVFDEEFHVDGNASDGGGLASITVNGEELLAAASRGALHSYFARRLPLDIGTNPFDVVACDAAGNRSTSTVHVVRRVPECMEQEFRLTVGVPPVVSDRDNPLGMQIKRAIEAELLRDPIRFRLLERDEGWDYILREQGLSASDLADPTAALRIGKMLPAELLLMGRLIPEPSGMTLHMRVVESANGEVLASEDVYSEAMERDLQYQSEGLVLKIEQRFPLVSARVLDVSGQDVTLDAGSLQGVEPGARFVVVEGEEQPAGVGAGDVLRVDGDVVQLSVRRVSRQQGIARVSPSASGGAIRKGCYAYAR